MLSMPDQGIYHLALADTLCRRATQLREQFKPTSFSLKTIYANVQEEIIPLEESEVEDRIRGYIYEGYAVTVDIEDSSLVITAKDC